MTQENIAIASIPAPTFLRSYGDLAAPAVNQSGTLSAPTPITCVHVCSINASRDEQLSDLDLSGPTPVIHTQGGHCNSSCGFSGCMGSIEDA